MAGKGNVPFWTDQCNLDSYFRERNLTIPTFQREYEWNIKEHIPTLWNDIIENLIDGGEPYFLATPVIYPMEGDTGEMGIVDGQQRTLTLSLFIAACRDHLNKIGTMEAGYTKAQLEPLIFDPNRKFTRVKTRQEKDKDVLEDVLSDDFAYSDEYGTETNNHRIAKCYRFFFDKISARIEGKTDIGKVKEIADLTSKIMKNTYFGLTEARDSSTAILIFMTMNARGMDLEQSDLVKAELFSSAAKVNKSTLKRVTNLWKDLRTNHNSKTLSNLLHDFIAVRTGATPKSGSYKAYAKIFKEFSLKHQYVNLMKEIKKFDVNYREFGDKEGEIEFTDLVRCKVRYAVCLMAQAKISGADEDQLVKIEKLLDLIYAHHFVGEKDSNILKRKIISWTHFAYKKLNTDELIEKMEKEIASEDLLLGRSVFIHNIKSSKSFDKMNEVQFLLRRVERKFSKEGSYLLGPKAVNIEHIAPRNPKTGEWTSVSANKIHSLGNLTLCPAKKNGSLGNNTWPKKVEIWKKEDVPYATTAGKLTFVDAEGNTANGPSLDLSLTDWNDTEIDNRAGRLAEFIHDHVLISL
jgi:uncharacterized protein with ParB-like and HNH nuclease domain